MWNNNMLAIKRRIRFVSVLSALLFLVLDFSLFPETQQYLIRDLKKAVVEIGKLDFLTDIPIIYVDKKKLKKYIETVVDEEYPDELSKKEGVFLQLMGFSDRRLNLKSMRKRILVNNARGMYNERTKELLATSDYRNVDMMKAMILVHEMRHAVQDEHYNLKEILGTYSDYDDRKLARLSAVEGDAAFISVQFSGFNAGLLSSTFDSDPLISFSPIGNTAQLYKSPEIIKQQLIMPYIYGLRFVTTVFQKKKWKGLKRVLSSPPDSTEQVLHPDKFLKQEKPDEVDIKYKPGKYPLYHSGVIGEHYLNVLLMDKKQSGYVDYALGWGGDTYKIYGNAASYFMIWKSVWDKEKYCSSFYFDFRRFIERRYSINFKDGSLNGGIFVAGQSKDGYFFLRFVRNEMIYVRSNDKDQMNKYIFGGNYD
jgi:hypothetical protein